jgi:BirA family biotin operon repressor/biotin-[acetyl-CoA-carboxylase] ligase
VSATELAARARLLHALGETGGAIPLAAAAARLPPGERPVLDGAVAALRAQQLAELGEDGVLRSGPRGSALSAARVRELRRGARYGAATDVRAVVGSTNDAALERATLGAAPGLAIAAELQTSGRGTKGRAFLSAPGLGVWSTTLLDAPADPSRAPRLSLLAGLAVAAAVERATGVLPGLKWPNDVRLRGRKVCGVLVEARSIGATRFVVAGIGLNVHHRAEDFPQELRAVAGSLEEVTGARLDRSALLAAILAELEALVGADRNGSLDLAARWAAYDELAGADVEVRLGGETFAGRAEGVEDDGRLRVRHPGGSVRAIRSAEAAVAFAGG